LVTDATGSVISKSIASIEARRMPPNQPAGSTTSIVDPNDLAWLKSFQAAPRRLNSECTPAATGTDWSTTTAGTTTGGTSTTEYGTALDSAFAVDLAAALKAARYLGTNPLTTYLSNGTAPHGEVQEVLTPRLLTVKTVQGKVWVKHNYGPFPTGSTNSNKIKSVTENRDRYREAVTVIFQRERGYHPETGDLFWVKYDPAGNVLKDSALRPLAGKIGKGDPNSCIGCHATACGSDYVCSND
jgi:hypothetical protein